MSLCNLSLQANNTTIHITKRRYVRYGFLLKLVLGNGAFEASMLERLPRNCYCFGSKGSGAAAYLTMTYGAQFAQLQSGKIRSKIL